MTTAYLMTYDNLVQDVQQYMERNDADFIAQIPTLIGLAESAIASELKTLLQLVVVQTNLTTGDPVLIKPTRWRKTVSMKINGALFCFAHRIMWPSIYRSPTQAFLNIMPSMTTTTGTLRLSQTMTTP